MRYHLLTLVMIACVTLKLDVCDAGFSEDKGSVGWSPLLWGLSYENIVPVVLGLSVIGQQPNNATTVRTIRTTSSLNAKRL